MKLKITILLLLASIGVMAQSPYSLNYSDIRMGLNGASTITFRGTAKLNSIATGLTSDSVVTILNGVLRKIPTSSLMSTYTAGNGLILSGSQFMVDTANNIVNVTRLNNALSLYQRTLVSGTSIKTIEGQSLLGSGNVDLGKADVGLGSVDNTSDANKPVSTAQQTALNLKANIADVVDKTNNQTAIKGDKTWEGYATFTNGVGGNPTAKISLINIATPSSHLDLLPSPQIDFVKFTGTGSLQASSYTADRIWTLPDKTGTVAVTTDISSAIASAATNSIQNQTATVQSGGYNIDGLAKAGSSSITGNIDVGGSQTVSATSTLQNVIVNNRIGVGGNPNTGIEYFIPDAGTLGIRATRQANISQYAQLDIGGGVGGRLFSTGLSKNLSIINNSTVPALGTTADGMSFQVPSATTGTTVTAISIPSGNTPAITFAGKLVLGAGPGNAADAVRLTDLKSNKLVTAASATITTAQLLANNGTFYIYVDASGGARTITLLSVAAHLGKTVIIQKTDASANVVTINGGAVNINQATTYPLTTQNASVAIAEDGTQFRAR